MPEKAALVHAPYNFVSLSPWIYSPEWAYMVSHDIPFKDALSGHLDIEIEARSPLLIGSKQANSLIVNFVKNNRGEHYLPATALKGMLRNVLEIAAFGKMQFVDDRRYSIRDLNNREEYGNYLTEQREGHYYAKAQAGWLKFTNGQWSLTPCDYARFEYSDMERLSNNRFSRTMPRNENTADNAHSPVKKYDFFPLHQPIYFKAEDVKRASSSRPNVRIGYKLAKNITRTQQAGLTKGHAVFGGGMQGKHMDFVFYDKASAPEPFVIDSKLYKSFEYIHTELTDTETFSKLKEWAMNTENRTMGIPVFYLTNAQGKPEKLGLTVMPKLAYKHSVHELVAKRQKFFNEDSLRDLPEILFGTVRENGEDSQRSRVCFSDAICTKNAGNAAEQRVVLNGPKASYYPSYIEQSQSSGDLKDSYNTYNSDRARIRGWKRYPATLQPQGSNVETPSEKLDSVLRPLNAGAQFKTRLRFFNLKPQELGALVWALTWGGDTNCVHSLGMGKPFGLGLIQCKIAAESIQAESTSISLQQCQQAFVEDISKAYEMFIGSAGGIWKETAQIQQLLAMANTSFESPHSIEYMPLSQFAQAKRTKGKNKDSEALIPQVLPIYGPVNQARILESVSLKKLSPVALAKKAEDEEEIKKDNNADPMAEMSEEQKQIQLIRDLLDTSIKIKQPNPGGECKGALRDTVAKISDWPKQYVIELRDLAVEVLKFHDGEKWKSKDKPKKLYGAINKLCE